MVEHVWWARDPDTNTVLDDAHGFTVYVVASGAKEARRKASIYLKQPFKVERVNET